MKSLVISPKNASDLKLISEMLKKMGIPALELSDEEKEDIGLSMLMSEADRSKKVSKDTVMKNLKS
jgi:hypothetical protein